MRLVQAGDEYRIRWNKFSVRFVRIIRFDSAVQLAVKIIQGNQKKYKFNIASTTNSGIYNYGPRYKTVWKSTTCWNQFNKPNHDYSCE